MANNFEAAICNTANSSRRSLSEDEKPHTPESVGSRCIKFFRREISRSEDGV